MILSKLLIVSIFISLFLLKMKASVVMHAFSIFLTSLLFGILFLITESVKPNDSIIFLSMIIMLVGLMNSLVVLFIAKKIKDERSKRYLNQVDVMSGKYD